MPHDYTVLEVLTCEQNLFASFRRGAYTVTYGESATGPYSYDWSCNCPSFKYRHRCRHIEEAKQLRCTWGAEAFCGSRPIPNPDGSCPQCGGPTRPIRVAV